MFEWDLFQGWYKYRCYNFTWVPFSLLQSLDPLPMHGRDLSVNPDDLMETPEHEAKQEVLENKEVSGGSMAVVRESVCVSTVAQYLRR